MSNSLSNHRPACTYIALICSLLSFFWVSLEARSKSHLYSLPETTTYESHGPACIASHCSHLFITNPWSVSHIAKTWVSLQITTYISKSNKYFDILLQLTCEEVLQAPIVQV